MQAETIKLMEESSITIRESADKLEAAIRKMEAARESYVSNKLQTMRRVHSRARERYFLYVNAKRYGDNSNDYAIAQILKDEEKAIEYCIRILETRAR